MAPPRWAVIGMVAASLGVAPPALHAALVRLKNGGVVRGTVMKQTATEVLVQTEMGTTVLAPDEILRVEPDAGAEAPELSREPAATSAVEPPRPAGLTPKGPARAGARPAPPPTAPASSLTDASRAVALIVVAYKDGGQAFGSGVVVTDRGLIVTNHHVVADAQEIGVVLPDDTATITSKTSKARAARVLKTDACHDLALLRIPQATPHYLRLAADEEVRAGEPIRVIGNPEGLTVSVSKGIVSAVRRLGDYGTDFDIPGCEHLSGRALDSYSLVQTDAAINPGNSGGPLINDRNEVVGIATIVVVGAQGLNFAIHAKHVRELVGSYVKE